MTRKDYTPEILRQAAAEISAVMEKVITHGLAKVNASPNWKPRLAALATNDPARDLACTSAALSGGYDPETVAEIFANDADSGKTRFLVQLLGGARAIHEKTGKGINFPFFPFFDHRKGESLVNALSQEECKLLGVGEFEPARSPASGSLDVLLKYIGERGSGGRTPAQVFFSYYAREEREEKPPIPPATDTAGKAAAAKTAAPAPPVNDLDDLNEPVVPAAAAGLEELAASAPVVLVDDLGDPIVETKMAAAPATPAPAGGKIKAKANGKTDGNGKAATNGDAAEANELADLLTATGKPVAIALAEQLRKGKKSVIEAREIST
ncbi:MAG: hypothetical protein Q8R34_00470, partial [bacterium]|nr:hypothetical protein [bacterium]